MLRQLKDRLRTRITALVAIPVGEILADAFRDPASLEGLDAAPAPGLVPEEDWTDVWDENAEGAVDPFWAMGLIVIQPAETFEAKAVVWDVHDLLFEGYSLGLWSKAPQAGGELLVPMEDEISWEAALSLLNRGVGLYWASPEEGDGPGFFVYP
jgi:hypothetical protein